MGRKAWAVATGAGRGLGDKVANIPHPMIVPIPVRSGGRRRTEYIMITFNGDQFFERILGYGTHGDFFVMQADQTVAGWEFGPK